MLLPGPPGGALNTQAAGGMYPEQRTALPHPKEGCYPFFLATGGIYPWTLPVCLDPARMNGPCPCKCGADWTLPASLDPARVSVGLTGPCQCDWTLASVLVKKHKTLQNFSRSRFLSAFHR